MKPSKQTSEARSIKNPDNLPENKQIQKDHRECQSQQTDFDDKKKELLEETQRYMYSQSSKFSSVSRSLVFGMIGTIWVITYTDKTIDLPNYWLLFSLFVCLLFLLADVVHYFWDSMSYQSELYRMESYKTQEDLDEKHEKRMDVINNRSHYFIVAKFIILLISALLFFIGIICKILN